MAINGPSDFVTPNLRQINNFLKLCIANVDFSVPGLCRKEGSQGHLQYCDEHILPLLKEFDFTIEELQITKGQLTPAAAGGDVDVPPKLKALKDDSIKPDLEDDKQSVGKTEAHTHFGGREKSLQSLRVVLGQLFAQNHTELGNLFLSFIEQSKILVKSNKMFLDHPYGLSIQTHLAKLFKDYKTWTRYEDVRYSDDTEKSPVQMLSPAYLTETMRLQLAMISFLYKHQSVRMAELLHNTMHICFLAAGGRAENTPFIIGKMMGMCAWVLPFGLLGSLDNMGIGGKQLATYAASFIEVGLSHGQFARPFNQNLAFYNKAIETIEANSLSLTELDDNAASSSSAKPHRKLSLKSIFRRSRSNSVGASAAMSSSATTDVIDELSELLSRTTLDDFYAVRMTALGEDLDLSDTSASSDDTGSVASGDYELLPIRPSTPRSGDHLKKANLKDRLSVSEARSLEQRVRVIDGVTEVTNPLYGKQLPTRLTNKHNVGRPRY